MEAEDSVPLSRGQAGQQETKPWERLPQESASSLLALIHLQLVLERNDPKALVTSAEEQQWHQPQQHLHEHPLTRGPRIGDLGGSALQSPEPCREFLDPPRRQGPATKEPN